MEKIVELKNVSKVYKIGDTEFKAIDNIDLSLNKGEMIVILVANLPFGWLQILGEIFKWVALVMTILSLVIYIYQNIDVLKEQK